jgi:hypothetical protein
MEQEVFPLLDQRLRPLYDAFICEGNPLVRHALRLTCKTLHAWIPISRPFVRLMRFLSGRDLAESRPPKIVGVWELIGLKRPDHMQPHPLWSMIHHMVVLAHGQVTVRAPLVIHSIYWAQNDEGKPVYAFEASNAHERLIGKVLDFVLQRFICSEIGMEHVPMDDVMHVFSSLLRKDFIASLYTWAIVFDSSAKMFFLERRKTGPTIF